MRKQGGHFSWSVTLIYGRPSPISFPLARCADGGVGLQESRAEGVVAARFAEVLARLFHQGLCLPSGQFGVRREHQGGDARRVGAGE
jgi:hypothetical protein